MPLERVLWTLDSDDTEMKMSTYAVLAARQKFPLRTRIVITRTEGTDTRKNGNRALVGMGIGMALDVVGLVLLSRGGGDWGVATRWF